MCSGGQSDHYVLSGILTGFYIGRKGNGSDVLTSKQARHTGNGSASEGAGPTDYQL